MRNATATLGERATRIGLIVLTGAVLVFLVAPILALLPLSSSSVSFFYYPLPGSCLPSPQSFFTPPSFLPVLVMLEDFPTEGLALPIAICGGPDSLCGA